MKETNERHDEEERGNEEANESSNARKYISTNLLKSVCCMKSIQWCSVT